MRSKDREDLIIGEDQKIKRNKIKTPVVQEVLITA